MYLSQLRMGWLRARAFKASYCKKNEQNKNSARQKNIITLRRYERKTGVLVELTKKGPTLTDANSKLE